MEALEVLRTIGYPTWEGFDRRTRTESQELYDIARQNKIGSLYIQALSQTGSINELQRQESERESFHDKLTETYGRLSEAVPQSISYVAIKSVYPFKADFKDIDLLVFGDDIQQLKSILLDSGFDLVSSTPVSFDVIDQQTQIQVDVQTKMAVRRVVYLDKSTINDSTTTRSVGRFEIPVPNQAADLAAIIAHSVIEQLYILKEFYYSTFALETMGDDELEEFVSIIRKNNLEAACVAFLSVTRELSIKAFSRYPDNLQRVLEEFGVSQEEVNSLYHSAYTFPHRYSRKTGLLTVADKFKNKKFLSSLLSELPHLLYPPTFLYLLGEAKERFTRSHYAHERRYD